jgi:hypothetical protein
MSDRVIDLNKTSLKSALKIMMAEAGIDSLADVARKIDMKETTFRSAINNDALRLKDFLKAAKFLGYTVQIQSEK